MVAKYHDVTFGKPLCAVVVQLSRHKDSKVSTYVALTFHVLTFYFFYHFRQTFQPYPLRPAYRASE